MANALIQKTSVKKLLKPGKAYPVGRKEAPLILHSKRVSKLHGEFAVDEFAVDDVVRVVSCAFKVAGLI